MRKITKFSAPQLWLNHNIVVLQVVTLELVNFYHTIIFHDATLKSYNSNPELASWLVRQLHSNTKKIVKLKYSTKQSTDLLTVINIFSKKVMIDSKIIQKTCYNSHPTSASAATCNFCHGSANWARGILNSRSYYDLLSMVPPK